MKKNGDPKKPTPPANYDSGVSTNKPVAESTSVRINSIPNRFEEKQIEQDNYMKERTGLSPEFNAEGKRTGAYINPNNPNIALQAQDNKMGKMGLKPELDSSGKRTGAYVNPNNPNVKEKNIQYKK